MYMYIYILKFIHFVYLKIYVKRPDDMNFKYKYLFSKIFFSLFAECLNI
jgi:hypothetical protein